MKAYSMLPPKTEGDTAHLYLLGDIVEDEWLSSDTGPQSLLSELNGLEARELTVHIDSYGGNTSAGITIYNLLKNSGLTVTTIAEGFVCSAASLIFAAGRRRIMRNSSLLMIHNAWTDASGNAAELRKTADGLEKISNIAANIYRENSTLDEETLTSLLAEGTWVTPAEAVRYGLATEIAADDPVDTAHSSAFADMIARLTEKHQTESPFTRLFGKFH